MASDLKPRLCVMKKGESGYGFHLHGEKGKTGQYIRKVERASPAEASGLRAGDRVVEVNGENVERDTHHQVVQRIKAVEHETRLLVVDRDTDEYFRSLRLTCTEDMAIPTSPAAATPSPSLSTSKQGNGSVSKRSEISKPIRKPPSRAPKKEVQPSPESSTRDPSELLPRLCFLVRSEAGYGFNLHSEKSRPGQYIRALDPGSPADRAGLKPQDRLIEVNGVNIENMRHAEVVAFIKNGGNETRLLVVDPDTDEHFKKMGITPTTIHVKDFDESITNGSSSPHVNGTSSRSTYSDGSSQDTNIQFSRDSSSHLLDPFEETGLCLSPTAAEAKEKAHAKRARKRAPQMDWNKKHEIFSNF
ncbi:Na(+)/H(+) exchange regulatory cofactor NHE-RF2 [Siphateles boraxobius]|uniref:Na(+)/H(+) exchange regulatory cofactor NHE-RF2 n=1 Tax=Siphateles boraxobius TaxID=180520 RepID=UPI004064B7D8